jgi:nucleoporin NUP159
MAHTPQDGQNGMVPESLYHLVTRTPGPPPSYTYQKLPDPAGPFSSVERGSPHQFFLRLRNFPPNLEDLLIIASTASTDIGLFSKCKTPLATDKPAEKITGVFTMTEMNDDSRRATLPISSENNDTSPIGIALDLSSTETVWKPVPTDDENDDSAGPVPGLMCLNHEGILKYWSIIYSESIQQRTTYPGIGSAGAIGNQASPAPAPALSSPAPAFGAKAIFGQSPIVTASKPSFGATGGSAFGSASGMGQKASVWGTPSAPATSNNTPAPAFGAPAFGSASSLGGGSAFGKPAFGSPSTAAFGSANLPGQKASPWGTTATTPSATFGQAGGAKAASPFGSSSSAANSAPASGGFANFASKGGFTAANNLQNATGSVFGKSAAPSAFGAPSNSTPFGSTASNDNKPATGILGAPPTGDKPSGGIFGSSLQNKPASGLFGAPASDNKPSTTFGGDAASSTPFGSAGFSLGTTFKKDTSANDGALEIDESKGTSMFGSAFGGALGEASPAQPSVSKEAEMDAVESTVKEFPLPSPNPVSTPQPPKFSFNQATTAGNPSSPLKESSTPAATPAPGKFSFTPLKMAEGSSLFGTPASTTPATVSKPATAGFGFGKDAPPTFSFAKLGDPTVAPGPKTPSTTEPPFITQTPATPKIKDEPNEESSGISRNISEAPLPPDPTSKTSFPFGESSTSSSETDESLPSGTPSTSEPVSRKKTPPSVESPEKTSANVTPPPDVPEGPADEGEESGFSSEGEEQEDGELEEEGEEADSPESRTHSEEGEISEEGSGEEVEQSPSPTSDTQETPGFTPQTSSTGGPNGKPAESSIFTKISLPSHQNAPTRPLFGEVAANVPSLPPPSKPRDPQSPRSPSPVRGAIPGRMSRPDASRSVSAPGVASQLLGTSQRLGQKPPGSVTTTFSLTREQQQSDERRRIETRARQEAAETQALVDEEDNSMQKYLAEDIEPTRTLDEFVAHTVTESTDEGTSIPAQVEALYRDVNSMIDTLGVNAKALKAFIMAHTEQYKESDQSREDLENEDDWVLGDIESLSYLVNTDVTRDLEEGRVKDIARKLEICSDLHRDLAKLRVKHEEVKKLIQAHRDPEKMEATRSQPLSADQVSQQQVLRKNFTTLQKLLPEAEESLTLLKVKIVSQATSNKRSNGQAVPTVEAVMRTIAKITNMAEKKSGDIDLLESQMRKLRFSSLDASHSREGSPLTTPNPKQSLRASGTYGFSYTPESASRNLNASFRSSTGSFSSPGSRKKLSGYTSDEKILLKSKLARRKEVLVGLKGALEKSGTNVRLMDE